MGETMHECAIEVVGRAKTWAIIDDRKKEKRHKAYLIQDREVCVRYENNSRKWVPSVLLTYDVGGNKESWLNYLHAGIRQAANEE